MGKERKIRSTNQDGSTRRDFISQASTLVMGACTLGAVAGSVHFSLPNVSDAPQKRFPLGRAGDFKTHTLTWLRTKELFVIRTLKGFGAFSSKCTHLGCTVRRTAQGFFCPCHGARYDTKGQVVAGPARRALPWYHLWIESDGRIWIDQDQEVPLGTVTESFVDESEEP